AEHRETRKRSGGASHADLRRICLVHHARRELRAAHRSRSRPYTAPEWRHDDGRDPPRQRPPEGFGAGAREFFQTWRIGANSALDIGSQFAGRMALVVREIVVDQEVVPHHKFAPGLFLLFRIARHGAWALAAVAGRAIVSKHDLAPGQHL